MELASCGAVGHRQQGGTKAFRSPLSPVPEAWAESLEQEEEGAGGGRDTGGGRREVRRRGEGVRR